MKIFLLVLSILLWVGVAHAQRVTDVWVETSDCRAPTDSPLNVTSGHSAAGEYDNGSCQGSRRHIRSNHAAWRAYLVDRRRPPTDLERTNEALNNRSRYERHLMEVIADLTGETLAEVEQRIRDKATP